MKNLQNVAKVALQVIEQNNQRVLLTSQLAESYETESKVISNNFNRNQERYVEGKHYFVLEGEDKRTFVNLHQIEDGSKNAKLLYLWTEKGALLHAKSLNTDKAWEVYEHLVDSYFTKQKILTEREQLIATMKLSIEHEQKLDEVENRVEKLELDVKERITLESGEQRRLQRAISYKVYSICEDKNQRKMLFAELYREIRDRFGVASYKDIKSHELERAIGYVNNWIPKRKTA